MPNTIVLTVSCGAPPIFYSSLRTAKIAVGTCRPPVRRSKSNTNWPAKPKPSFSLTGLEHHGLRSNTSDLQQFGSAVQTGLASAVSANGALLAKPANLVLSAANKVLGANTADLQTVSNALALQLAG